MVGTVGAERAARALEFGIYRDGDNNLDRVQAQVIAQAEETSARDHSVEFTVEDTTARRGFLPAHVLRTETYGIADGEPSDVHVSDAHDMADRFKAIPFGRCQQIEFEFDGQHRAHGAQGIHRIRTRSRATAQ